MNSRITIRPYAAADSAATINVFLRAIRETASKDYSPAQINAWARVDDPIAWGQHRLTRPAWVAAYNGQVIGFTDLVIDANNGYLDMLFVHPEYQGLGVASQLLACVEKEARRLGCGQIDTEASLTARLFFERKGFVLRAEQAVAKRGQLLTNFVMTKHDC